MVAPRTSWASIVGYDSAPLQAKPTPTLGLAEVALAQVRRCNRTGRAYLSNGPDIDSVEPKFG